jgi:hypothetical protein
VLRSGCPYQIWVFNRHILPKKVVGVFCAFFVRRFINAPKKLTLIHHAPNDIHTQQNSNNFSPSTFDNSSRVEDSETLALSVQGDRA